MKMLAIAAAIVLAGCSARGNGEDDKDAISNRVGDWEATLAQVNNSRVRGTAAVQSVAVGSGVTISIEGATPGAQHPWHVHVGRCGSNGAIVGSVNYPVLQVGSDGRASANITINAALRENESYHVNVHRSAADLATIISCGNLSND